MFSSTFSCRYEGSVMLKILNYLGGIKYINDNMTVASIAEKMHILTKCLKCIYITMYTVKDNILGKKVCWRLATNQPKNCRKIGQRCVCE